MIHSTALVAKNVKIAENCAIGPYCIIEENVVVGQGVKLDAHVILKKGTVLEDNVRVHAGAVIGDDPQILNQNFDFTSGVWVGESTIIREGVTIHRASQKDQFTKIGRRCLLMAFAHVGHDTCVGDDCILANQVLLAGCVNIQNHVFLSGGSMVHQFVHVGESAFIAGNAVITVHVPPFITVVDRNCRANLNVVGLQRRGFSSKEVADIKAMYRCIYDDGSWAFKRKAEVLLAEKKAQTDKGKQFLNFFVEEKPSRGFVYEAH